MFRKNQAAPSMQGRKLEFSVWIFAIFLASLLCSFYFSGGPARSQQAPSCVAPPPNMVGWWPGDGNYKDIIGGNNGTPVGGVTFAGGEVGQAFGFNGTDASVQVPDTTGKLKLGAGEITLDAWINAPPFNGTNDVRTIVAKNNPSYPFQGYFLRTRGDNRVEFAATDCENRGLWI